MKPFFFSLPVAQFDRGLLRPEARTIGTDAFKKAIVAHFTREYAGKGQTVLVSVDEKMIEVAAFPGHLRPFDIVVGMLNEGRIKEAIPYLEAIDKAGPPDAEVLYNLGIAYSETGQFDEAILRLKRAVALRPAYSRAWTGIGVAYQRLGKRKEAIEALRKAVEADPGDGYAHRNLGSMLMGEGRFDDALPHLREALHQLPDDPYSLFGLAQCLQQLGSEENLQEADRMLKRIVDEFPASPVAERAREARTALAHSSLRASAPGGFRPDVMMYIAGALEAFEQLGPERRQEIGFEIALLGQQGLDINDPTQKYTLKSLPGKFSGLHLLSMMYTAFRQIDPSINSGADFSEEFEAALKMKKN